MRNYLWLLLIVFLLPACGKFKEKFSRLDQGFTRVHFEGDQRLVASMDGGMMVYFVNAANHDQGKVFGFDTAESANGRSVVLPNGPYNVYALGTDGSAKLDGQARCGFGNGGNVVNLTGGAITVNIALSDTNCSFGYTSVFTSAAGASNVSDTNFDSVVFNFCTSQAYPSCSPATASSYRVKFRLLGGEKNGGSFSPVESESVTSSCSTSMSSGTITSTWPVFIGSSVFSPPFAVLIYSDSTCLDANLVTTLNFTDGMHHYLSVASGSTTYVDIASSSSTTYLKFVYP